MGEIFPSHIRATAASAATLTNWGLSFIVTMYFGTVNAMLGNAVTFAFFAGVCALGAPAPAPLPCRPRAVSCFAGLPRPTARRDRPPPPPPSQDLCTSSSFYPRPRARPSRRFRTPSRASEASSH